MKSVNSIVIDNVAIATFDATQKCDTFWRPGAESVSSFAAVIFGRYYILIGLENYQTFATLYSKVDPDFLLFVNSMEYFSSFQWYTLRKRS